MATNTTKNIKNAFLQQLRKNGNMTMKDLAARIGSRYEVISRLESGKTSLTQNMAERLAPHLETTVGELLEGKSKLAPITVDVAAGRHAVELIQTYDELLPESAHESIRGYIKHMVDFYTSHQDVDENVPHFPRLNRTRDGWPWGLRHLGRVLTFKGAQIGLTYERLNIHRAKKVRIGKEWRWQTQMYVMGSSEPVGEYMSYDGGANPVVTQMAKAVNFQSGVFPSEIFQEIPHFEWNTTNDVMFIFLRNTVRTFICLQFSGEYTAREFALTEGIAEEFMEEFGGDEFSYEEHSNGASSRYGGGSQ